MTRVHPLLGRLTAGPVAWTAARTPPAAAFVLAVWAGLTGLLFAHEVRFGMNLPYQDEWFFTPVVVGDEAVGPWLFARHNEHVYPLGRLVFWAATRATGDFRAGAYLTVGLLSAAALALVIAARRARGRWHPVDVLFPALLLHWGHFENLLLGYQIVLTLPLAAEVALLVLFLRQSRPAVLGVGVALLVVLQGGGFGLAVVPPVALWLVAAAVSLRRRGKLRAAAAAFSLAITAIGLTAAAMLTAEGNAAVAPAPGWAGRAAVALHYLGSGLGPAATVRGLPVPWAGIAVLVGHAAALALLAWTALRCPAERFRAGGLAAIMAANLTIAVGLGMTRDVGYAPRYAAPAALGVIAVGIAALLYGPTLSRRGSLAAGVLAVALAAGVVLDNVPLGRYGGDLRRFHSRILVADALSGMPPAYLASKHTDHLFFPDYPLDPHLEPLARHGFGPLRFAPPDPPIVEHSVPCGTIEFPAWSDRSPPSAIAWSGERRKLLGVRVRFTVATTEPFLMLTLRWGDGRSAAVYRRPRAGEHEALFWVNDEVGELRIEQTSPGRGLTVTGVWLRESSETSR